jgi:adenosylcobinamide kinase/adenosylcobinamide-phosphate guanylyltransferase
LEQGCLLVLGGAKSGKSTFALQFCNRLNRKRIFMATAEALDPEMAERIARHRAERGRGWHTREVPLEVPSAIGEVDGPDTVVLLDCLTLWLSNLFMKPGNTEAAVGRAVDELIHQLGRVQGVVVVVSNEVGMGIVPGDPLSRTYRDTVGSTNQRIASMARKVVAVVAGLPQVLKDA